MNWRLGQDLAVNDADTVWKTFVGERALYHQGSKVSKEHQTAPKYFFRWVQQEKFVRRNNFYYFPSSPAITCICIIIIVIHSSHIHSVPFSVCHAVGSALVVPSDISVFMFWSEPWALPSLHHATLRVITCFWVLEFFLLISLAQIPAWLLIYKLIKNNTVCNFM